MSSFVLGLYQLTIAQNVGVGTTTPAAQLHIKYALANTLNGVPVLILDNPSGGTQTTLQFRIDGVETGRIRSSADGTFTYTTIGNGDHIFRNEDDNSEIMILQAVTGNVGIGTTTPGCKLHIQEPGPTVLNLQSTYNTAHFRSVSPAGVEAGINFSTMTGLARARWIIGKGDGSETGADAGSNLIINRYDDGGNYLGRPLEIVRSTGEVLINNKLTTPSFKFLSGATSGYILQSDASGNASWASPSSVVDPGTGLYYIGNTLHSMWSTSGADIYSDNTGNVSIGAVSPLAKLAVYSPNDRVLKLESMSATGTWLEMQNTSAGGATFSIISTGSDNGEGAGKLLINTPGSQLAINSSGNLGVGTTSPAAQLHVKYASANTLSAVPALILDNPNGGTQTSLQFRLDGTEEGRIRSDLNGNMIYSAFNTGDHTFRRGDADELMIIKGGTGFVGIGTISPAEKLDVSGRTKTTDLTMTNGASNGYILQSDDNGNASWVAPSSLSTSVWTVSGANIYKNNTGNVGIGTSSPSALLHVNNSTGNATVNIQSGTGNAQLNINAGASGTESSVAAYTNGSARWSFGKSNGAESGSDAGSDFFINRYNDAGAFQNQPFIIKRSTGNIGIGGVGNPAQKIDVSGNINVSSTNGYYIGNSRVLSINGSDNVMLGVSAASSIGSGSSNVVVGKIAAEDLTTGSENTVVGFGALNDLVSGNHNVAVGYGAGLLSTGGNNTFIGHSAGSINTGSGSVMLGYQAGSGETGSNKLYIDNNSTATPLVYGDFSKDSLAVNGSLTIEGAMGLKVRVSLAAGTTNPSATGGIWIYSSGTGTIDLSGAAYTDRVLIILNNTGAARIISSYRDLTNTVQTTIGNNVSLWLVYDGTNWRQIK